MIGNPDVQPPIICQSCGADKMGCQVKAGLSGRRCCDECGHDDDRRGDGVEHHDLDGVDHHDLDGEDLHGSSPSTRGRVVQVESVEVDLLSEARPSTLRTVVHTYIEVYTQEGSL